MANEQDGPPPRGNDDRVQAWLKNQERDPEAQADSKTLTVIPARGAPLPGHLDDVAACATMPACCSCASSVMFNASCRVC